MQKIMWYLKRPVNLLTCLLLTVLIEHYNHFMDNLELELQTSNT